MPNPFANQGTLNRVKASVTWLDFPELNVTAPFLGRDGISLGLEGNSTTFLPTLTGTVVSPEVYMMIGLTIHLLKPQNLGSLYKAKMEDNAMLGNGVVRPDLNINTGVGLTPYDILNCAIESVREMRFNGTDEGFVIMCRGFYPVNNSIW